MADNVVRFPRKTTGPSELLNLHYVGEDDEWPEALSFSRAEDATSWTLPYSVHVALEQMTGHRWQHAWFAALDDRWNHG